MLVAVTKTVLRVPQLFHPDSEADVAVATAADDDHRPVAQDWVRANDRIPVQSIREQLPSTEKGEKDRQKDKPH